MEDPRIGVLSIDHVQVSVPSAVEAEAKRFYEQLVGLTESDKPNKTRGGAWYQLGAMQLHLSVEDGTEDNRRSRRHVCYRVADLARAEAAFRRAGVAILADDRPQPGWRRFYVHDPGGNRLEIAQPVAE